MLPGFHALSFAEYAAVDAVNASKLSDFARSPAACRLRMTEPEAQTRAMRLGVAVHVALIEPDSFGSLYAPVLHDGRTKAGIAERERVAESGATALSEQEHAEVLAIARSLYTHPRVASLLARATAREQAAVWTAPQGRLCKARRDLVGPGWICDVKTTSDLERFSPWQVTDLGYYRQAAWYAEADRSLTGEAPDHFFLAVAANTPPHESAVFRLSDEAMDAGREENRRLLDLFLECERTGAWPRHVAELLTAEVAFRKMDEIRGGRQ